ncbi:MAG: hypothetical protein HKM90_10835 [Desulfobacteraceae bacterium]|nr:hypothetical protein [Desulfobacteraceae bacterium]
MDSTHKYRLRVEICIGTIIDVHKSVNNPYGNDDFLSQFEKLKEAVDNMDMTQVSEGDVLMVEQATNALLGEFRSIYETGDYGPVYEKLKH